jgi:protein-S-isoprenylcysteine O-methyltransferase Ste14
VISTRFERVFVWLGGGMFVAALAASTFTYLIRWATPSAHPRHAAALLADVALLTVFAVHHSVFARESTKKWMASAVPARLQRSVYVWTASVLLLLTLALWRPVGGDLYIVTGWPAMLHAVLQLAGLALIARSVARIDALELAGIRPAAERDASQALQTAGPYRWVRHPLYLGWVIAVFGAAHMTADRLTFAAVTTAYLIVAVPWEERSLRRAFGDDYARYAGRVRWRIIPYVY